MTGTPRRLSASAQTIPTGPAPTMTTRLSLSPAVMPICAFVYCGLSLSSRTTSSPSLGVFGDDSRKLGGSNGDRIDAEAQQSVLEVRAHFRGHDLAGHEVDDIVRPGASRPWQVRTGCFSPIRSGLGLRLGVNVGYLKFTPLATWNPF
jgi:hypothetical protein